MDTRALFFVACVAGALSIAGLVYLWSSRERRLSIAIVAHCVAVFLSQAPTIGLGAEANAATIATGGLFAISAVQLARKTSVKSLPGRNASLMILALLWLVLFTLSTIDGSLQAVRAFGFILLLVGGSAAAQTWNRHPEIFARHLALLVGVVQTYVVVLCLASVFGLGGSFDRSDQAFIFGANPNELGTVAVAAVALLGTRLILDNRGILWLSVWVSPALFLTVVTSTRAAFLAILVIIALIFQVKFGGVLVTLSSAVLVPALAIAALTGPGAESGNLLSAATGTRSDIIRSFLREILDRPLTGTAATTGLYSERVFVPNVLGGSFVGSHNHFLAMAYAGGLFLLIVWLILAWKFLAFSYSPKALKHSPLLLMGRFGLMSGLALLLFMSGPMNPTYIVGLIFAVSVSISDLYRSDAREALDSPSAVRQFTVEDS